MVEMRGVDDRLYQRFLNICLERGDFEAGNALEVAYVERGYLEAEVESCGSDDEAFKSNDIAKGCLFAFDAACELCDFEGH